MKQPQYLKKAMIDYATHYNDPLFQNLPSQLAKNNGKKPW